MPDLYPDQKRHDPYRKFNFQVSIHDNSPYKPWPAATKIPFSEVSGLRSETEIVEYKEGDRTYKRKIMGQTSFDNVVLTRGMDSEGRMALWRQRVLELHTTREDISDLRAHLVIELYDRSSQKVVAEWVIKDCWPTVFETEDLDGNTSDVLIQRLELACEEQEQTLPLLSLRA